jgi:dTDP-4-amino-4,6-dideoxygalactose transaminase
MATETDALKIIAECTGKKNIKLTERGNFAIFSALYLAKKLNNTSIVLVPDQGGWISFETYPKMFGFFVEKVKTNHGLIDLTDLEEKMRRKNVCAFIITSLAGYFAEQDVEKIQAICKEHQCILIEDATGIISKKVYGDIVVGSFGHWKPVNLGYGGFIATDFALREIDEIFSLSKTNFDLKNLIKKLKNTGKRIEKLEKKCAEIKKDLKHFEILHRDKRGLNVVVKFYNENEKKKITEYCNKKKLEYVVCPKNIRVLENAISIEVKRLD